VIEGPDEGSSIPGARADLLVLDHESPLLAGRTAASALDTFLFAGNNNLARHVMVDGAWVVRDFIHRDQEHIAARYRETANHLIESL
jgi:formimidoylglutamate deiminase